MAISEDARAIVAAIITAAKTGGGPRDGLIAEWKATLKALTPPPSPIDPSWIPETAGEARSWDLGRPEDEKS